MSITTEKEGSPSTDHAKDFSKTGTEKKPKNHKDGKNVNDKDEKSEEYTKIMKEAAKQTIGDATFTPLKTTEWNNKICEKISTSLQNSGETRKFIVQVVLTQNGEDVGLCTVNQCYWNTSKDSVYIHHWENSTTVATMYIFTISHRYGSTKCAIM